MGRLAPPESSSYCPENMLSALTPIPDLAGQRQEPASKAVWPPMLEELRKLQEKGLCPRGVMHCWGGTPDEMESFLELGFYISFSGTVTFPKAESTHACARQVPDERFLVETDCPFLAPVPRRGKRNEPAYVEAVAAKVAELRGISLAAVAKRTTENAMELFSLH